MAAQGFENGGGDVFGNGTELAVYEGDTGTELEVFDAGLPEEYDPGVGGEDFREFADDAGVDPAALASARALVAEFPMLAEPQHVEVLRANVVQFAQELGEPALAQDLAFWRSVHLMTLEEHGDPHAAPDPQAQLKAMVMSGGREAREPGPTRTPQEQAAIDAIRGSTARGSRVLDFG